MQLSLLFGLQNATCNFNELIVFTRVSGHGKVCLLWVLLLLVGQQILFADSSGKLRNGRLDGSCSSRRSLHARPLHHAVKVAEVWKGKTGNAKTWQDVKIISQLLSRHMSAR